MLITIEGCVGTGKTAVSQGLAETRRSTLLLEDFESNPFLKPFYSAPAENAIEVEFTFLMLHYRQLRGISSRVDSGEFVADFHLWKDMIYGSENLRDPKVLRVFEELYEILVTKVPTPTVLVMLSASDKLVLERIARRGRGYEQTMPPDYYARVNDRYRTTFEKYRGNKILVSMDEWDFVEDTSLFAKLSDLVDQAVKR
ncbi:MAG TPA: deoxynucleoside kinase [Bryobacteraceae bacterium]|jgi:deoxyguanosine kinase